MVEDNVSHLIGIDGATGKPVAAPELDELARRLREKLEAPTRRIREFLANPNEISDAGWGVLFAKADERAGAVRAALKPLLERRKDQAGDRYREYMGNRGYLAGEIAIEFLERHGASPGPADPKLVPCYLLIVGSPEEIPYEFQYQLDHQRAVGRLHFDRLEDYTDYADAVVAAEATRSSRKVAFFGPRHDPGTEISSEGLLSPLIQSVRERPDCWTRCLLGENATKKGLKNLLTEGDVPDLLFTAGHGLLYGPGHDRQLTHQGALVCQDWDGKKTPGPHQVFAGEDLNGNARLQGMLAFLFACNSAGAPRLNDFASSSTDLWAVAPRAFISALAQRLLRSGALAVVGHVEQVWQCSFLWRTAGSQPQVFIETLRRLLDGAPVGWALEPINAKYADLAASLVQVLQDKHLGLSRPEKSIADLWTACRDARNYVIVGDPAVRLNLEKKRLLRGG